MKLHLGCGQVYLKDYTNIDFPPSKHTVQVKSVADENHDLLSLKYKGESIQEVRLHHVYEHFTRPIAIALLASWHTWLKKGGVVHIEVPDFDRTARIVLNPFSKDNDKKVALRHIFGSNEADWATHYEGWSEQRLKEVFELLGFEITETIKGSYKATRNITVIGKKVKKSLSEKSLEKAVSNYLAEFLVDKDDAKEKELLKVWMKDFTDQYAKTKAK